MPTTYETLQKRVMLRVDGEEGRALMAVKEAINTAQKTLARVHDFDELIVLDTTSAATVASTKLYHLEDDWSLTRPKDIFTLRLMDEANSIKLTWVSPRRLDAEIPYTEMVGERRPKWYTQRGNYIELFAVPDAVYSLSVFYSQWPAELTDPTDETPFVDLDDVIIGLAADGAQAIIESIEIDWATRAKQALVGAYKEDISRPDRVRVAQPFQVGQPVYGEYWKDPFVTKNP